jgi:ribonuclease PH
MQLFLGHDDFRTRAADLTAGWLALVLALGIGMVKRLVAPVRRE